MLFQTVEKEIEEQASGSVNGQPGAGEDSTVYELPGGDKVQAHLPEPSDHGQQAEEPDVIKKAKTDGFVDKAAVIRDDCGHALSLFSVNLWTTTESVR